MRGRCPPAQRYLKPRRDVDAITEYVIAVDQDVSKVNPNPEQHTPVLPDAFVPLLHHRLHGHRAFDRIDHRGKLKQHAVPCSLDDAAPVLCHESIGDHAVFTERVGGAYLIGSHKATVTGDIGRQYRCQSSLDTAACHEVPRKYRQLVYQTMGPGSLPELFGEFPQRVKTRKSGRREVISGLPP